MFIIDYLLEKLTIYIFFLKKNIVQFKIALIYFFILQKKLLIKYLAIQPDQLFQN